jgi:outer membrane protein
MRRLILIVILLVFFLQGVLLAQDVPLSLDEALTLALNGNRDVRLKTEDVKKAKLKIAESQSGFYPALTFSGGWTQAKDYYAKDLSQTTTQTTFKQYLYKGGKTANTVGQSRDKLEVASAILDKTKLDLMLSVKKAFYTLALAREFSTLNKGILDNTVEHLEFLKARYLSGQASESDVLRVKESLTSVEMAHIESMNQVEATAALFNNLLYLDDSVRIIPEAVFDFSPREIAYGEAFLSAMKNRPEIKQYTAQARADKKAIEINKADNRPDIYFSWDYYTRSHTAVTNARGWNDYNILGLTFTWPVFDGWATKAKVEEAIVDLKQTNLLREKAVVDIALELKSAYLDLENAIAKIKSAQAQIQLYRDTFKVAQDKYNSGILSSLDLHDANLGYEISLFNQKQANYDYIVANARFDKATGGI